MTKTTPRDFFLNLGILVSLYFLLISFISLLFAIINRFFPDPLAYYDGSLETIRWTVSSLIILFPLHVFLVRLNNKEIVEVPEKKHLWVRRWGVYLTLFLAGAAVATDFIILLNYFLGGEVTIRFGLKVGAVLLATLFVFKVYLYDLKRTNYRDDKIAKGFIFFATAMVVIAIGLGFWSAGSPMQARETRFDDQRINDLIGIQSQLVGYWQAKETLPESLDDLNDPLSSFIVPVDPKTGASYEYSKTNDLEFVICAEFALPYEGSETKRGVGYPYDSSFDNFAHDAGRQCFTRTIDPEFYAPLD